MRTDITADHMKQYVESNPTLVACKNTSDPGVFVLKYKPRVFHRALWTPELIECRGTLVDADYNIIARPFTKVFNYGENKQARLNRDAKVVAIKKVNGFMACVSWYDGCPIVSTTGSIDSEFARLAEKAMWQAGGGAFTLAEAHPNISFSYEITDPSDPHIIEEEPGVWLLGARPRAWDSPQCYSQHYLDQIATEYGLKRPKHFRARFGDVVKLNNDVRHEGFVVYCEETGFSLKLKSPYYLVTKFIGRMNDTKLVNELRKPQLVKEVIDEEFYGIVDFIGQDVDHFLTLNEQQRIAYVRAFFNLEKNKNVETV